MPLDFQSALAGVVFDREVTDSEVEWGLSSGTEIEIRRGKPLNEALRLAFGQKPCHPNLNRLPERISGAPV